MSAMILIGLDRLSVMSDIPEEPEEEEVMSDTEQQPVMIPAISVQQGTPTAIIRCPIIPKISINTVPETSSPKRRCEPTAPNNHLRLPQLPSLAELHIPSLHIPHITRSHSSLHLPLGLTRTNSRERRVIDTEALQVGVF